MRSGRRVLTLVAVLGAVALAACGSDDGDESSPAGSEEPAAESSDPGLQHIHGLGVRGDTLYIATHTGLWVAPDGQTKARRFGESRQDIMGFSVVAGDRFIGSGHPDPSQSLPPNLGLIESRDGGKTWKNVSLLGDADFHVLESAGRRVYGFDGTQGRLMVSDDGGRGWAQRTPPAAMFGLAIDPRGSDSIVVATEKGLFTSPNAGRGWRPLRDDLAGLLAWPSPGRLYLVGGDGTVQVSSDGGRDWQAAGDIAGQPAAFMAHGRELYAALHDGTVKRSTDGGRSWTVRATP
jgi:photosystem II stability/assembly factor-like uncharacterized protein